MNIIKEALRSVSNYPGGYGMIFEMIYGETPNGVRNGKEQVLRNTLSKMKKRGLLLNQKGLWKITEEGERILKEKENKVIIFPKKKLNKKVTKTMIVVFDIPEKERLYRDWLRNELAGFGYELVQKSVWFGPALPKEFIEYLDKIKILQYIKFFRATESDLV